MDCAGRKIRGQHPGGGASGRRDQKARIRTKASEHGDKTPQREDLPESDRMAPDQWAYGAGVPRAGPTSRASATYPPSLENGAAATTNLPTGGGTTKATGRSPAGVNGDEAALA